jgi:hypothetical protein
LNRAGAELSGFIDAYLSASKSRSLMGLATRSGVGYTTIRRMLQCEQSPSLSTALSILQVVATDEQIVAFAKKHWPDQATIIEKHAQFSKNLDKEALFAAITDREAMQLLCLSATDEGLSAADADRVVGLRASSKMEKLVSAGLVEEKRGRYYGKEFLLSDLRSVARAIHNSADVLVQGADGQCEAATWQVDGLSEEGVVAVKNLIQEFADRLQEIRRSPANKGKMSTVVAAFAVRMDNR